MKSDETKRSPRVSGLNPRAVSGKKLPAPILALAHAALRPRSAGAGTGAGRAATAAAAPVDAGTARGAAPPPPPRPGWLRRTCRCSSGFRTRSHSPDLEMAHTSTPAGRGNPTAPQWLYRPVPANSRTAHGVGGLALPTSDNGLILGARVRGKKHKQKHQLRRLFEVRALGDWTIIAVAMRRVTSALAVGACGLVSARRRHLWRAETGRRALADRHTADRAPEPGRPARRRSAIPKWRVCNTPVPRFSAASLAVDEAARSLKNSPAHERLVARAVSTRRRLRPRVAGGPHDDSRRWRAQSLVSRARSAMAPPPSSTRTRVPRSPVWRTVVVTPARRLPDLAPADRADKPQPRTIAMLVRCARC